MRRILIAIFVLVVFGIALALVLENLRGIQFNYLFGSVDISLAAALALAVALGAIIGVLAMVPAVLAARVRARRSQKKLHAVEQEIDNLRKAPLRDAR